MNAWLRFASLLCCVSISVPGYSAEPEKDPFYEGSVWTGDFRIKGDDAIHKIVLTVTSRDEKRIGAEVLFKLKDNDEVGTFSVSGTATNRSVGAINLVAARQGAGQGKFIGKLENGVSTLVFTGLTPLGRPISGVISLKSSL